MTDFEQLMVDSQKRIESSLQECLSKLAIQGERIAASEANIAGMQKDIDRAETWSYVKFIGSILVSCASAIGIKHIKI